MSDDQDHLHGQENELAAAMRLARAGDAQAYKELLEAVGALLQVYAGRALKRMGISDAHLAEDVVQETLLALHVKRHTYDSELLFTPWLFAIARYKVIDFARRRRRDSQAVNIEDVIRTLEAPVFSEPGAAADLDVLLGTLPERARRILERIKLEGLSVAEVAAAEQMSESAVKVAVHRALKALRSKL